ncbi:hypothetical protein P152DRAFT_12028 [Eremomyces bilateralis CBS 781.70]|uniref:Uncharacterized protein n=1 Tax=Eremomyces bilateralis CBS 781.70 TaxID=1392243 RepID=A0A6G1GGQ3_9PEZI|nr:uncharacterized protein P152DRAFT_12028 [Eremomyces bilateralis CBS 781.70]KAF1817233.1 hypothetical protein P152DRAFT_12028 [Eremomyces bilateralis CBS 781.70]
MFQPLIEQALDHVVILFRTPWIFTLLATNYHCHLRIYRRAARSISQFYPSMVTTWSQGNQVSSTDPEFSR